MGQLTQKEIAEHLDMSDRNARDVLGRLKIDHKTTSLDDIRIAYIRYLRELAAGRGGEDQYDLAKQRARQAAADANLKELQYEREVGSVVAIDEIEPQLAAWATAARSEIGNAIEHIIAMLESKHGIEVEREDIDKPLDAAYAAIAAYPTGAAGDDEEGGEEMETAA